jgi:cell division transport system ATP-binding protein
VTALSFEHVSKRYPGGRMGLSDVSFSVAPGEMLFLTGHSGAGKTTLLKLIALIDRASGGQIRVGDKPLDRMPAWRIPYHRRQIGIVFQDNKLLTDRTVRDNVALPLVVSGCAHDDIDKRVRAALDLVGLLDKERSTPLALSAGEQQRLGIARAIVNRPALLIADEPTGNLDPALADQIMDLFHAFHRHGTTVLIATHDLRHIRRLGCRALTLDQGMLVHDTGAPT